MPYGLGPAPAVTPTVPTAAAARQLGSDFSSTPLFASATARADSGHMLASARFATRPGGRVMAREEKRWVPSGLLRLTTKGLKAPATEAVDPASRLGSFTCSDSLAGQGRRPGARTIS